MFKKLAIGVVTLIIAGAVVPAQAQEKIKLGFMTPLSGPLTFLGKEQIMGMELALDRLGYKLGGIPVEVIKADGRMSAATANQAVTKLVEQDKSRWPARSATKTSSTSRGRTNSQAKRWASS